MSFHETFGRRCTTLYVMFASKAVLFLSIAAFGFAPLQGTTYSLREKHNEGSERTYEIAVNFEAEGFTMEMKSKNRFKITKVNADGSYEEEDTLLGGTIKFNGEEQAIDPEDAKTHKYDKDGKEIKEDKEEEEDPISTLLDLLDGSDPVEAVKAGQKWEHESKVGKTKFEFVGPEKLEDIETLKSTCEGKFTKEGFSGDMTATSWVRASDASLQKLELKTDNMVPGEGSPAGKVKITVTRTE